jgi:hypothetical protein
LLAFVNEQAAKRNPRLLTTISEGPEKIKKRRKPSKKERDYKKKMKLEEEKKARNERRYEKFLKYGQTQGGARKSFNRAVSGGRGTRIRTCGGLSDVVRGIIVEMESKC